MLSGNGKLFTNKILKTLFALISLSFLNSANVWAEIVHPHTFNIILIDPGHGGIDGGAVSKKGTIEKYLNLSISLKVKERLKKDGYNVLMTREDDNGLYAVDDNIKRIKIEDLNNRCRIKRDSLSTIFISIHQNFFKQSIYSGPQVWYSGSPKSIMLAHVMQKNLNRDLGYNIRKELDAKGAYKVLRCYPYVPSIIIECGFLTNPKEEAKLNDDEYQNKIADSISKSVNEYFQLFEAE